MDKEDGVWRTIRGRRIFIKKGESLESAMTRSGKFKNLTRTKLRETKDKLREENRLNNNEKYSNKQFNTKDKEKYEKYKRKGEKEYNKFRTNNKDEIELKGTQQAQKNRINENANIEGSGKTRVQRNWNKYSEEDRREHRHELIQKRLADYKAKKQSNNKIQNDYVKESKEYTKNNASELSGDDYTKSLNKYMNEHGELGGKQGDLLIYNSDENEFYKAKLEHDKQYLAKKQSNNKVEDYYKGTKRWGFGMANDDNIPVYNNKIDYSGDFTHANLSKVSDDDLTKILNKQSELYHEASNRQVGDRRTRNGKNDEIFKKTDLLRYENGMNKINEEMQKRNMPRYNIYNNKTNTIMASSPTKEMADRQLKEMYDTDKKLGEHYGWKEYPEYSIKQGYVDDYLNEVKKETIKNYVEKKKSNNNINTSSKILSQKQLAKMSWEDVVKANTEHYSKKSIYDFEGERKGKYKYEEGWRDNRGGGVIKQSELDKLITKEEWKKTRKGK